MLGCHHTFNYDFIVLPDFQMAICPAEYESLGYISSAIIMRVSTPKIVPLATVATVKPFERPR